MAMGIRRLAMILGHTSGSTVRCSTPGNSPSLLSISELKQLSCWTAAHNGSCCPVFSQDAFTRWSVNLESADSRRCH